MIKTCNSADFTKWPSTVKLSEESAANAVWAPRLRPNFTLMASESGNVPAAGRTSAKKTILRDKQTEAGSCGIITLHDQHVRRAEERGIGPRPGAAAVHLLQRVAQESQVKCSNATMMHIWYLKSACLVVIFVLKWIYYKNVQWYETRSCRGPSLTCQRREGRHQMQEARKKEHRIGGESRESFMTGKEKKDLSH